MAMMLRFRIELLGIDPPIWRRILVPGDYSLWDLHVAIQDAMGWSDTHLHLFRVVGSPALYGIPDEDGDDPLDATDLQFDDPHERWRLAFPGEEI